MPSVIFGDHTLFRRKFNGHRSRIFRRWFRNMTTRFQAVRDGATHQRRDALNTCQPRAWFGLDPLELGAARRAPDFPETGGTAGYLFFASSEPISKTDPTPQKRVEINFHDCFSLPLSNLLHFSVRPWQKKIVLPTTYLFPADPLACLSISFYHQALKLIQSHL
jgi:hypothetical protein